MFTKTHMFNLSLFFFCVKLGYKASVLNKNIFFMKNYLYKIGQQKSKLNNVISIKFCQNCMHSLNLLCVHICVCVVHLQLRMRIIYI